MSNTKLSSLVGGRDFIETMGSGLSEVLENCGESVQDVLCNKDTGAKRTLQMPSRGHLKTVTPGGIIRMFNPIYRQVPKAIIF